MKPQSKSKTKPTDKQEIISYIVTGLTIVINFDGKTFTVTKGKDKRYDAISNHIKRGELNRVKSILSPVVAITQYHNEYFTVDTNGIVYMSDDSKTPIPNFIGTRLIEHIRNGIDILPIVKFWKNLRLNPSLESREDLLGFLEKNGHPLTPDGLFIAYKKVTTKNGKMYDSHTGTIEQIPGKWVTISREKVDPNRDNTCSSGLHVAALEYAKGFSGNVLLEVLVNPVDVVVVPPDYNQQKMRTCAYYVIGPVKQIDDKTIIKVNNRVLDLIKDIKTESVNPTQKTFSIVGMTAKEIESAIWKKWKVKVCSTSINPDKRTIIRWLTALCKNKGIQLIS